MNIFNSSQNDPISHAINIISDQKKLVNVNPQTRIELGRSVKVLRGATNLEDDIPQRIIEAEWLMKRYDRSLSDVLDRLATLRSPDHFMVYMDKGEVKIETLDKASSFLDRIGFKIRKMLRHDINHLQSVFQAARLIAEENEDLEIKRKLSTAAKRIRAIQPDFYKSSKAIARHAKLTKEINKILDLTESKKDIAIQKKLIKRGEEFLYKLNDVDHFKNLTGIAIASTTRLTTNQEAIVNSGGYAIFSTENERATLKSMLEEPDSQSPLSVDERQKVEHYVDDLDRSRDLNFMLAALSGENDAEGMRIAAKTAYDQILSLKEGQSIFLDVGYTEHSMRAQFTRKGDEIEINLFDTSGALEFWINKNPFLLMQFLTGKKQYTALSTSVNRDAFKHMGQAYLEQVIMMDSKKIDKWGEEKPSYVRYIDFMRVFRSINPKGALQGRHSIQKAYNCFAQRIRACEAYCLGIPLYKKIRRYSLKKIYDDLWKMAEEDFDKKQLAELSGKLETAKKILSPRELRTICRQISRLTHYPKTIEEFYPIFALINHNILSHGDYVRSNRSHQLHSAA